MENFSIYYLLITIDYFSVAQTTVLIGVNLCLTESDLKKQSQYQPLAGNPKRVEWVRFEKTKRAPGEAGAIQQVIILSGQS
jgi:hypothetical protein